MDAVKFVNELIRMNKAEGVVTEGFDIDSLNAEEFVTMVEQWSKDHPRKTNREVFLEVFGDTDINKLREIQLGWNRWLNSEYFGKSKECTEAETVNEE